MVKLSAIGDVVHTLPLLETIKKYFPDTRIDWLVEQEASDIVEGHGAIDQLIVSRRKSWQKRLRKVREIPKVVEEVMDFIGELRGKRYDIVIDLQGLFKSGLLTGLCRGNRKIGLSGGREGSAFFLTERPYSVDYDQHAIDRYLKAAEYLDCPATTSMGHIPLRPSDMEQVDRLLLENGLEEACLVAVNPMARWVTKLWETEKFSALADRIIEAFPCEIVFTGSSQDRPTIDRIIGSMTQRAFNLAGRTSLKGLAYLFAKCRTLITTDTGPMHIAAAMNCPVVALFGPTAPERTGPYGNGHRVVRAEIECSPCFKKKCDHKTCMRDITVDRVFEAVDQILVQP